MKTKSVQPDFGVFEGIQHSRPGELLLARGIVVVLQSELDELALFFGQELGRCRVIVHAKISQKRYHDGQQSFLRSLALLGRPIIPVQHTRIKIHRHPLYPPTPRICAIAQARIPPKAPASDAALKNSATR